MRDKRIWRVVVVVLLFISLASLMYCVLDARWAKLGYDSTPDASSVSGLPSWFQVSSGSLGLWAACFDSDCVQLYGAFNLCSSYDFRSEALDMYCSRAQYLVAGISFSGLFVLGNLLAFMRSLRKPRSPDRCCSLCTMCSSIVFIAASLFVWVAVQNNLNGGNTPFAAPSAKISALEASHGKPVSLGLAFWAASVAVACVFVSFILVAIKKKPVEPVAVYADLDDGEGDVPGDLTNPFLIPTNVPRYQTWDDLPPPNHPPPSSGGNGRIPPPQYPPPGQHDGYQPPASGQYNNAEFSLPSFSPAAYSPSRPSSQRASAIEPIDPIHATRPPDHQPESDSDMDDDYDDDDDVAAAGHTTPTELGSHIENRSPRRPSAS